MKVERHDAVDLLGISRTDKPDMRLRARGVAVSVFRQAAWLASGTLNLISDKPLAKLVLNQKGAPSNEIWDLGN